MCGRYVYRGAPLGSSGLSGIAGLIGVRTGGRRFHQGSLRLLGCALGVVGFVLGNWVHWGAPWGSLASSGVCGFIGVRLAGRRVHAWIAGFIEVLSSVCSLAVRIIGVRPGGLGLIRACCVHRSVPWGSSGPSCVAGFIGLHSVGRHVHPGSLGSLVFALGFVGFIRRYCVQFGTHWRSSGPSGLAGFMVVRPGGRRVYPGLLGSVACALGFARLIRGHWVLWGAPWGSCGSYGVIVVRTGDGRIQ